MKKMLLVVLVLLTGCDNIDANKINGIKFTDVEIQTINERGIPVEYIQKRIDALRENGINEKEIKESILSIEYYENDVAQGLRDIIQSIKDLEKETKNGFYKRCYEQFAQHIKTFEEREFLVKYCECSSDCVIKNIKFSNGMPTSLSEEDEKDIGKVELAWIELEKNCKAKCLKK